MSNSQVDISIPTGGGGLVLLGVRANDLSGDEDLHESIGLLLEFERSSVTSNFILFTARCDDST